MRRPATHGGRASVIALTGALTATAADRGALAPTAVFAVRAPPIVHWIGRDGDAKASLELDYDHEGQA